MKTDQHLDDLMVQWGQARAEGQLLAAEDLCHDCPELVQPLRERLTILEAMSWLDEVNKHQPGDDTLPEPASLAPETCRQNEIPELAMPPETLCQKLVEASVLTAEESRLALGEAGADEPLSCQKLAEVLLCQGKLTAFQLRRVVEDRGGELVMGNYLLLDEIGAGGMGRVYRVRHRRMKRVVALKVLASDLVSEPALQRFHREVEAMARLDHPNIVTAHDAADAGGRHFLVMQYVDGEDLARLVARRGPLTAGQALDCLLQAARGLEYAHEKGIIHRDIKPSNLMLDRTGAVKVLDLGLARLTKTAQPGAEASSDFTEEQVVMGTADYMAPEQALDTHRADQKSDIYSLGCTLHFLLTGRPVYGAPTLMGRMIAHRELPIPSLRERNPEVPEYLEAVFQKMVAKNPGDRYPSMSALLKDLGGHAERSEKLHLDAESATFLTPGALVDTSSIACRDTLYEEKPSTPQPRPRARRFRAIADLVVLLGLIAVAVGLWAGGFRVWTPDGTIVVELEGKSIEVKVNADHTLTITDPNDDKKIEVKVEKGKKLLTLTKEGFQAQILSFNLSTKDGRRLRVRFEPNLAAAPLEKREMLIVSNRTGNPDIFLTTLDGSIVKNLTDHPAKDYFPTWSPDGRKIAFLSNREDKVEAVYIMDADGGNVKRLTHGPWHSSVPAWSPDGREILFYTNIDKEVKQQLCVVNVQDGTKRQLTNFKVGPGPGQWAGGVDAAWSPDGKKIVFISDRNQKGYQLSVMDADGGNVKEITSGNGRFGFAYPAWSPDGKRIAFAHDTPGGSLEVFVCDPDGGNRKQLTSRGGANTWVAWTPDSQQITFQHLDPARLFHPGPMYIMDADGGNQRVLLQHEGATRIAWRPLPEDVVAKPPPAAGDKSQILFVSQRTGNHEIFMMNLDGTGVKNLTNHSARDEHPAWSPDGQSIAFGSNRDGVFHLYLMDAEGKNLKQLTTGPEMAHLPAWSPDGRKLLYSKWISGIPQMVVLDLQDGTSQQLTGGKKGEGGGDPSWSPDGKQIAFSRAGGKGFSVYVMDADGENTKEIASSRTDRGFVHPAWSPDGKKVAYAVDTSTGVEVFVCDPDGQNQKQLTHLAGINSWAAWSPDSQQIIFQHREFGKGLQPGPLYIMDADGGNQRVLLQRDGPGRAAWRPVSKKAAMQPPSPEPKLTLQRGIGLNVPGYWVNSLALTAKQDRVLSSGGGIHCIDLTKGGKLWTILDESTESGVRRGLVVCPDGEHFWSADFSSADYPNPHILKGRIADGQVLETWPVSPKGITSLKLSPKGDVVAGSGRDGSVRLWDIKTMKPVRTMDTDKDWFVELAFSPDGQFLLGGRGETASNFDIFLWNAQTGKVVRRFVGHFGGVHALAFLPGGKEFLSAGKDGTIRCWKADTGKEVYRLERLGQVNCLAVFADGGHFLSGGGDDGFLFGKVRLHETGTGRELSALEMRDVVLHLLLLPGERQGLASNIGGRVLVIDLPALSSSKGE